MGELQQADGGVGVSEAGREIGCWSAGVFFENGQHGFAGCHGVVQTLDDEEHGGVAGGFGISNRAQGGLLDRFAREIHGAGERGIDLARFQSARGEAQGDHAGDFFGHDGEAGSAEIEPAGDAVGDDIRQAARDGGGSEGRADRKTGAPAQTVARDFGIHAHAGIDAGAGAGQRADFGDGSGGGLHGEQLLGQALFEVGRGEAEGLQFERDFGLAGDQTGRDDRDLHACLPGGGRGRREAGLFHDQVAVVAAETEGAEGGAARAVGRPGFIPLQDAKRGRGERGVQRGVVHVQRGGADAGVHGADDFEESSHARGGDRMADVRLYGTDRDVAQTFEHAPGAADFTGIADGRAGGVAFDERDIAGFEPGNLVRGPDGPLLPGFRGREQSGCAAVIADADSANYGEYAVAGGEGVR